MGFNYEYYLNEKFTLIIRRLIEQGSISEDIKIVIADEQAFLKLKPESQTLYLVFKRMNGDLSYGVSNQPYQLLLLSEENQLNDAKLICDKFSEENNFTVDNDGSTYVKHIYQKPVVLSNFNEVQLGYRSVIYISAQLLILDNLLMLLSGSNGELNKITIDGQVIDVIGFNINYNMTPDTQQFPNSELSRTEKSTAGVSISFAVPLKATDFNRKVLRIISGELSGNTPFAVSFMFGSVTFSYSMKLLSAQPNDDPEQAPGLNIGLIL